MFYDVLSRVGRLCSERPRWDTAVTVLDYPKSWGLMLSARLPALLAGSLACRWARWCCRISSRTSIGVKFSDSPPEDPARPCTSKKEGKTRKRKGTVATVPLRWSEFVWCSYLNASQLLIFAGFAEERNYQRTSAASRKNVDSQRVAWVISRLFFIARFLFFS